MNSRQLRSRVDRLGYRFPARTGPVTVTAVELYRALWKGDRTAYMDMVAGGDVGALVLMRAFARQDAKVVEQGFQP